MHTSPPLIRVVFYLPVERRSPFYCSALRFPVRSPHAWRLSGAFPPLLAVNKKQQTLQRLVAQYKTLWSQQGRGSSLTVAPEVRGHSPRYWRSFGFSLAHHPGWMRSSRCSCVGVSQSSSMGTHWDMCVYVKWCERASAAGFFAVVDGECFQSRPTDWTSSVSVSASCLSTELFALRYADGGCPMFSSRLCRGPV